MKIPILIALLASAVVPGHCFQEIWNPNVFTQMVKNQTLIFGDFIRNRTSAVGEVIGGYVDDAQKKTDSIKKGISDFIDDQRGILNASFGEYLNMARSIDDETPKITSDSVYDIDQELSPPQIIARYGYPSESHVVKTEDGYLLTLFRIPRGKTKGGPVKRQPVLLHHGLLTSSADWILSGPEKALAFILADLEYDVWLANTRGNTYSKAHVNLSIEDKAFWNFSWQEIGYYDVPAYINYIEEVTDTKGELLYIGHSMGTTVLFVLLTTRPEYNSRIKAAFAMAPVAYMSSIESPIRYLAPYSNDIEFLATLLGNGEFLANSFAMRWFSKLTCELNHIEKKLCENSLFVICGFDAKQFNRTLMPAVLSKTPAGTSAKTMVHYAQEIMRKGNFQKFDYGEKGNQERYGSRLPPEYDLSKITVPISMLAGKNDWLSSLVDVKRLYGELKNPGELYVITLDTFNHIDFMWAIDAPTLVYKPLIELMNKYKMTETFSWSLSRNGMSMVFK